MKVISILTRGKTLSGEKTKLTYGDTVLLFADEAEARLYIERAKLIGPVFVGDATPHELEHGFDIYKYARASSSWGPQGKIMGCSQPC